MGTDSEVLLFQEGHVSGWTEALQMMHEGDKWELYIPSTAILFKNPARVFFVSKQNNISSLYSIFCLFISEIYIFL